MTRLQKALVAGLLLAIGSTCFMYTPAGLEIEESFGLPLLYKLRGPRQSPANVVIINIDDNSSDNSGLPIHFSKWPRTIHAQLVDRLKMYGAKIIAFDIHFAEHREDPQDLLFADAIRRAGNVILVEEMLYTSFAAPCPPNQSFHIEMETLIPPIQPLAHAALALAPFPLPKIPVRLNSTWRFKPSCGNIPTLPSVVFQAATLNQYKQLHNLLIKKIPHCAETLSDTAEQALAALGLVATIHHTREVFLQNSWLRNNLVTELNSGVTAERSPEAMQSLVALIEMYGGESSAGIDFYGPPASLTTFSSNDILASPENPASPIAGKIRDTVVFVGAARKTWSNQKDGFYTVFSRADGVDLSGVELAATVFANLSENRTVHKLPPGIAVAVISACAVIACLISFLLTPPVAAVLLLGEMLLYLSGAHITFSQQALWMPLIVPLFLLPLTAFLGANLTNYLTAHRERRNVKTALGFYLPASVVAELSKDLSFINKGDKKVYSTCLITDAENYTTLSERMPPEDLSTHMKEYYQYLFGEVKKMEGVVCNIIGDSMLALWPSAEPAIPLREKGCQAALRIAAAVAQFNSKHQSKSLPTRIGLHCGYLLMDNIGAEDHFEYAPVGDIINTVSRIEGLNKRLATQILASEQALQGVTGIDSREIGLFLLSGKTEPVTIYELSGAREQTENWHRLCSSTFPEALVLFRAGKWDQALAAFKQCLILQPADGPSHFYVQLCESYRQKPPSGDWQGIIQVSK